MNHVDVVMHTRLVIITQSDAAHFPEKTCRAFIFFASPVLSTGGKCLLPILFTYMRSWLLQLNYKIR